MKNVTPIKDLKTTPLTEDNATAGTWVVVEADNLYQHKVLGVVSRVELYEDTPYKVKISLFPSLLFPTNDPGLLMHVDSEDAYYTPTGEPTGIHAPLLESRVVGVLVDQPPPYYAPDLPEYHYDGPACDDLKEEPDDTTNELFHSMILTLPGHDKPIDLSITYHNLNKSVVEVIGEVYDHLKKEEVKKQINKLYTSCSDSLFEPYSRFEVKEKANFITIPFSLTDKKKAEELEEKLDIMGKRIDTLYKEVSKNQRHIETNKEDSRKREDEIVRKIWDVKDMQEKHHTWLLELNDMNHRMESRVEELEGKMGSVVDLLSRSEDRYKQLVTRVNALLAYSGKEDQLGGLIKEEKKGIDKLTKILNLIKETKRFEPGGIVNEAEGGEFIRPKNASKKVKEVFNVIDELRNIINLIKELKESSRPDESRSSGESEADKMKKRKFS